MAKNRIKIPEYLQKELLYKSAHTCNVCRIPNLGLQIHHIDLDPSNNIESNLIVLCKNCHDEAHVKRLLSQNLDSDKLTHYKQEWQDEVIKRSSLAMLPSKNLNQAIWTYINHQKLIQIIEYSDIGFNKILKEYLIANNTIDSFGLPILKKKVIKKVHVTIYDYFKSDNSDRLHKMYCAAVDELILAVNPIEIGAIWSKSEITTMLKPGSFIFAIRGFYFKTGEIINKEEDRQIYARSKNIELRWYANTRHMFGISALYTSFSGHRFIAAFLFVKSIEREGKLLVINCTPISMGSGFIKATYKTPHLLKYGWKENE